MVTAHSIPNIEMEGWEDSSCYSWESSASILKMYGTLDNNWDN